MSHADPSRQHHNLTFAVLALGGGAFAMLQSLVAPALPAIQHDLHTSATAADLPGIVRMAAASGLAPHDPGRDCRRHVGLLLDGLRARE